MDERDKKRLRKNRCSLVENLETTRIEDLLIKNGIFTPDMVEEISAQHGNRNQIGKLLNMLERRGCSAYEKFRSTLQEAGYDYLVKDLDNTQIAGVDEADAKINELGKTSNLDMQTCRGTSETHRVVNNVSGNNNFAVFGGDVTINHYK